MDSTKVLPTQCKGAEDTRKQNRPGRHLLQGVFRM